ncbi:capsid and scaffold protein [Vibrio phage VEN]|uniref:Capsid and scaffold protein n=1 Tax=Vibrio phage VEN TaxID=2059879 RepID=A0A2H5BMX1_9CAUD|nr:head scaffolding protein [Vibrio phage VEN]AUG87662.1 capsid and scaffold protein [Vibrio phage VEN]
MQVEIIDNNNGVLDLTGGASNTTADHSTDTTLDLTGETDASTDSSDATDTSQETDESTTDGTVTPEGEQQEEEGGEEASKLFFGGEAVTVDVPEEISGALKEAGLDADTVVKELFAKGGKFELSEDTYKKLSDKFGATMVDGYLNLYRQQNQASLDSHKKTTEDAAALTKQQGEEYVALVGGKEGLESIESFVLDNFDDNQLAAYNSVMESDSHAAQMLILSQVKGQMEAANKLKNGDTDIKLVGDESAERSNKGPLTKGYLTSEEYQDLIGPESKYWTDAEYASQVDAARLAGLRK